jgi:hypothetical protein
MIDRGALPNRLLDKSRIGPKTTDHFTNLILEERLGFSNPECSIGALLKTLLDPEARTEHAYAKEFLNESKPEERRSVVRKLLEFERGSRSEKSIASYALLATLMRHTDEQVACAEEVLDVAGVDMTAEAFKALFASGKVSADILPNYLKIVVTVFGKKEEVLEAIEEETLQDLETGGKKPDEDDKVILWGKEEEEQLEHEESEFPTPGEPTFEEDLTKTCPQISPSTAEAQSLEKEQAAQEPTEEQPAVKEPQPEVVQEEAPVKQEAIEVSASEEEKTEDAEVTILTAEEEAPTPRTAEEQMEASVTEVETSAVEAILEPPKDDEEKRQREVAARERIKEVIREGIGGYQDKYKNGAEFVIGRIEDNSLTKIYKGWYEDSHTGRIHEETVLRRIEDMFSAEQRQWRRFDLLNCCCSYYGSDDDIRYAMTVDSYLLVGETPNILDNKGGGVTKSLVSVLMNLDIDGNKRRALFLTIERDIFNCRRATERLSALSEEYGESMARTIVNSLPPEVIISDLKDYKMAVQSAAESGDVAIPVRADECVEVAQLRHCLTKVGLKDKDALPLLRSVDNSPEKASFVLERLNDLGGSMGPEDAAKAAAALGEDMLIEDRFAFVKQVNKLRSLESLRNILEANLSSVKCNDIIGLLLRLDYPNPFINVHQKIQELASNPDGINELRTKTLADILEAKPEETQTKKFEPTVIYPSDPITESPNGSAAEMEAAREDVRSLFGTMATSKLVEAVCDNPKMRMALDGVRKGIGSDPISPVAANIFQRLASSTMADVKTVVRDTELAQLKACCKKSNLNDAQTNDIIEAVVSSGIQPPAIITRIRVLTTDEVLGRDFLEIAEKETRLHELLVLDDNGFGAWIKELVVARKDRLEYINGRMDHLFDGGNGVGHLLERQSTLETVRKLETIEDIIGSNPHRGVLRDHNTRMLLQSDEIIKKAATGAIADRKESRRRKNLERIIELVGEQRAGRINNRNSRLIDTDGRKFEEGLLKEIYIEAELGSQLKYVTNRGVENEVNSRTSLKRFDDLVMFFNPSEALEILKHDKFILACTEKEYTEAVDFHLDVGSILNNLEEAGVSSSVCDMISSQIEKPQQVTENIKEIKSVVEDDFASYIEQHPELLIKDSDELSIILLEELERILDAEPPPAPEPPKAEPKKKKKKGEKPELSEEELNRIFTGWFDKLKELNLARSQNRRDFAKQMRNSAVPVPQDTESVLRIILSKKYKASQPLKNAARTYQNKISQENGLPAVMESIEFSVAVEDALKVRGLEPREVILAVVKGLLYKGPQPESTHGKISPDYFKTNMRNAGISDPRSEVIKQKLIELGLIYESEFGFGTFRLYLNHKPRDFPANEILATIRNRFLEITRRSGGNGNGRSS